jgi:hypothetical protein
MDHPTMLIWHTVRITEKRRLLSGKPDTHSGTGRGVQKYLSIFPLTLSDKRDFQIETDMIL